MKLIESVPNFSEGRNKGTVEKICQAILASENILLDKEMDSDHNRAVITAAGTYEHLLHGIFDAVKIASKLIDLNNHSGVHPRIGASDVIPFIPLKDTSMEDCVKLARELGKRISDELDIPVYLYGEASLLPERKNLAKVRKGQFEILRDEIKKNPDKKPDFGRCKIHPTAGATAVGARFFLIAYNINLKTTDVNVAKEIAKTIRESSGGLQCVKALGLYLEDKKMAQVSMNLTDYRITSIPKVYNMVEELANNKKVEVAESELIGLVPEEAIDKNTAEKIKLKDFSETQIIEKKLNL